MASSALTKLTVAHPVRYTPPEPPRYKPEPSASLVSLTNLVSYWKLDEASGNALDAHGTNTLTDSNTVTSAAGKIGDSRHFTRTVPEYFTIADNASLSAPAGTSFTF